MKQHLRKINFKRKKKLVIPFLSGRTRDTIDAPQLVTFKERPPFFSSNIPIFSFSREPLTNPKATMSRHR